MDVDLPESEQEITLLDLAGPDLTDNAMKQVAGLRNLRTLCLDRASATDAGAVELQKALPDCKFRLRDCPASAQTCHLTTRPFGFG